MSGGRPNMLGEGQANPIHPRGITAWSGARKSEGAWGPYARPHERLIHDSGRGPRLNPERRRCEVCGRRMKHCRCGG